MDHSADTERWHLVESLFESALQRPPAEREAAEANFRRALELNPDLSIAHNLFAYLEAETGHAETALLRLLPVFSASPTIRICSPRYATCPDTAACSMSPWQPIRARACWIPKSPPVCSTRS